MPVLDDRDDVPNSSDFSMHWPFGCGFGLRHGPRKPIRRFQIGPRPSGLDTAASPSFIARYLRTNSAVPTPGFMMAAFTCRALFTMTKLYWIGNGRSGTNNDMLPVQFSLTR